jgi:hypothetical protein
LIFKAIQEVRQPGKTGTWGCGDKGSIDLRHRAGDPGSIPGIPKKEPATKDGSIKQIGFCIDASILPQRDLEDKMATRQEKLLQDYYRKLAGAMLVQYTEPQNPEEAAEYRHFREMYLLMICSCEAIGDFQFARELDTAYKVTVGVSCKTDASIQVSQSLERRPCLQREVC